MSLHIKKLIRLLDDEQNEEVRAAALIVLGQLGICNVEASSRLLKLLNDPDQQVRLAAIRSAGLLKLAQALPVLLEKITHGGPEASVSAEAAAKMGSKGVRGLQKLMHTVAPGVKRYIAAALTASGARGADHVGVQVLFDHDPAVARAAADAMIAQIPTMPPDRTKILVRELLSACQNGKKPLPATAELPVVRLLAALNDPRAQELFWKWSGPPHAHEVRATALTALGGWIKKPTQEQLKKLLQCAQDADFQVAAPALMILQQQPVQDSSLTSWLKLFDAPDVAARRLAIDKLGSWDQAEVARRLMDQLYHQDKGISENACLRLQQLSHGRRALLQGLINAESAEDAWPLVRALRGITQEIKPAATRQIIQKTTEYVARQDPRADPLLVLARELDSLGLQGALLKQAVECRKKRKYAEALSFLKTLARDPGIGFAVRLELALCGLKVSPKVLDPHARNEDHCLRDFETLMDQDFDLLEQELTKAKFLDAEDLLYVGFHFSEQVGRRRQFGIDILKQVAKSGAGEAARAARNKLRSVGA